jgi:hypothetical protein
LGERAHQVLKKWSLADKSAQNDSIQALSEIEEPEKSMITLVWVAGMFFAYKIYMFIFICALY